MESLTVYLSSKFKKEEQENAYVYEKDNIKYGKYIDSKMKNTLSITNVHIWDVI